MLRHAPRDHVLGAPGAWDELVGARGLVHGQRPAMQFGCAVTTCNERLDTFVAMLHNVAAHTRPLALLVWALDRHTGARGQMRREALHRDALGVTRVRTLDWHAPCDSVCELVGLPISRTVAAGALEVMRAVLPVQPRVALAADEVPTERRREQIQLDFEADRTTHILEVDLNEVLAVRARDSIDNRTRHGSLVTGPSIFNFGMKSPHKKDGRADNWNNVTMRHCSPDIADHGCVRVTFASQLQVGMPQPAQSQLQVRH